MRTAYCAEHDSTTRSLVCKLHKSRKSIMQGTAGAA
jgi:hypothetical protein